jgi:hypothetical protein
MRSNRVPYPTDRRVKSMVYDKTTNTLYASVTEAERALSLPKGTIWDGIRTNVTPRGHKFVLLSLDPIFRH